MTTYRRGDIGLRQSRGPTRLDPAQVDGLAFHWPAMSRPVRGVAAVMAALRSWQDYHMDTHGWSDIGYQVAVDQDGNRYNLRGLGIRSGANGGTDVNRRYGACLLVVAPGEQLTDALVAETRRVVRDHRRLFTGSSELVGHSDVRPEPTACPGPIVTSAIRAGTFEYQEDTEMALNPRDIIRYRLYGKKQGELTLADVIRDLRARQIRLERKVDRLLSRGQ